MVESSCNLGSLRLSTNPSPHQRKMLAAFSLGFLFLLSLVPFQGTHPRSLSIQSKTSLRVAAVLDAATPSPAIVSYPDTNRTRPPDMNRPYFILHVGPPKTATTTLQTEMTKYGRNLKLDNYAYMGQIMRNDENLFDHWHGAILKILKDRECQVAVNKARLEGNDWPECWQDFIELLQKRRDDGHNIIYSEEDFAIKYAHLGGELGRAPIDWPSLKMVLEEQGWEPIIIVGYRRLYEIMPSAKQQWDRWTRNNEGLVLWPPEGRVLQPLFPGILKDPRLYDGYVPKYIPRTIQWSYTDHLIQSISPHLPVRLLNMHDPLSIRSTFLCRVLPYAPNACRQSQIDDAKQVELHKNTEESLFYDAIVTEAAAREWFDKSKFDRHQVVLALRDYFEQERGENPNDLPLVCPNTTQLEVLLERSLVKEEQILTRPIAETMRDEHIKGFWKAVQKHKFCWIDVDKTLEDDHWREFFSEIVPADEYYYDDEYYEEAEEARERHF